MDVRRTVLVALEVDSDDAALLEDTVDTFLWSAQSVVDHAFTGEYVTTSKQELTHPDNRDNEDACLDCGYENHADYNAAKNVGLRYLRRHQTGADGGAPLGVRVNSGTMTVNGGYAPGSPEPRTGVHAESHPFTAG